MFDIGDTLAEYGAVPSAIRLLDDDSPELLSYATLTTARRNGQNKLGVIEAVYEWQGSPLMFLVRSDSLDNDDHLQLIRRLLAMRGDAPYLGVVAPGSLRVFCVSLDNKTLRRARVDWHTAHEAKSMVFPRLCNERPKASRTNNGWISNVILRLLLDSMKRLIGLHRTIKNRHKVSHEDAISLVGRALFTRFLADRKLVPDNLYRPEAEVRSSLEPLSHDLFHTPDESTLFDTPENAERTSRWLDDTFNGDLLPLSENIFETLPKGGYKILGSVLRRAPEDQLSLGWQEKWDYLDFGHIPVGVLSQAYEGYLKRYARTRQKNEGGYFTPKAIAELMVQASFSALEEQGIRKSAKVLDPAVGGGIFLLTAFQELVKAHWQEDKKRPDTQMLRRILYGQLAGFDINEAALRFTALGLYLLAIELDPNPEPIEKLRFEKLRGTVLHHVVGGGQLEGNALGSLGSVVGEEHKGQYDLVIGNPPWSSATKLPEWDSVCKTVARIAADRGVADKAPPLPNEVLDLPFVWRAMEWVKPNGQIAFALHARLLFQQGDGMPIARRALFEALDVTSVINGSELRKTKVWPQVSAPFCLLFAANRIPDIDVGFRFISPRFERSLNSAGDMRIDAANVEIVPSREIFGTPEILKILFRGSYADLGILERIRAAGHPTLADFWRERVGTSLGNRLLGSGNGYQTLMGASRVRKHGDQQPGADASYLHGRSEIVTTSFPKILIDDSLLGVFSHERIHDPRSADLFAGPQTIVHKSPPAHSGRMDVAVSDKGVVFNEKFYGYSPAAHQDPNLLARYFALVLGSKLVIWLALVTSGRFGFEREVIEKATIDRIPIPDFDKLDAEQRSEIIKLVNGLQSGEVNWDLVDHWVVRNLYGLGNRDMQVILDTLEFNLPFAANKRKAQDAPNRAEREQFCEVLQEELRPWCDRFGAWLTVDQVPMPPISPWQAIAIRTGRGEPMELVSEDDWFGLASAADNMAASEIIFDNGPRGLLIYRLVQRRYWSQTQARLLAQRIVWSYVELLKGHARA